MPRNDRACCECQGTVSCCDSCSDCLESGTYRDVNFEITPAILECSSYAERICDPNCIEDFSLIDPPYIPRKLSGCQEQKFTTSVQYAGNPSCCAYYEDADGGCGCSAYNSDFYDSWINNEVCPDPIGGGVIGYTYRNVSGTARVYLKRTSSCLQAVQLAQNTGNAQYSTCISGTDNYIIPAAASNSQNCSNTDAPTGCNGLSGNPSCKGFNWQFRCDLCPFCPPDFINDGQAYVQIYGSIDVIRDYYWVTQPLNGSSSCWPALPASSATEFQFSSLMAGFHNANSVTYKQTWSTLRAVPTHSGAFLYGIGVEFDDFTI